ncbi:YiiX family permuted papain-like enzyme [Acinetobacter shaoyimingii]|uniref:YiiX family permuted papain-like enzyme n=2 Tax=Acinetobacter shaoyimingii TaxID=2715164 RepID=A0A6G8S0D7_9GAMM|nr:YiiX family permuted papain-like enzyme [Acinetobacter shaoyimingii]
MVISILYSPILWAKSALQTGDIIFHVSKSQQSLGIQKATHSPYSHMGMIVNRQGQTWVLEAIQPVKYTPLQQWIQRGVKQHYVVKRLKSNLTLKQQNALVKNAEQYLGRPYDIYFGWDNTAIYCSELVWKAYHDALGVNLAPLEKLKQFDLTAPEVKKLMQQRYGKNIPWNETVIAPKSIYESKILVDVIRQ